MDEKRGPSQAAIWILIGIALVVFVGLKYKFSNDLVAAKEELGIATKVREEQLAVLDQGGRLEKRADEFRQLIARENNSINNTFQAFSNSEMSDVLIKRLEIPADVGVLIAQMSILRSHLLWAPKGEQHNVVLYAKMVPAKSPGIRFDLFAEPDHRIEIPLPQGQLTKLTQQLRDTDSGVEFFWQFGEHKPFTIPFEGFSENGWSSRGVNSNVNLTNFLDLNYSFYDSDKIALRQDSIAELFKKGIWDFVALNSYGIKSDDDAKQLQVAVVLESTGPFYVSAPQKSQFAGKFELTWEEAKAGYRVELKSE